uniref:Kinesin-like protein KIF28P-like n=1 Tax=Saccoglossus kowalevskii TaxID=10224 RepID=A0ABM0M272_SACKO|nr:PREDICTED: kinesin-like protein KIF28P-like [Saccoglossus kowalevskii]
MSARKQMSISYEMMQGFNCSLFAYGQTGSGKSYSMVGYGKNRGIVPITCDELFNAMAKGKSDIKYQITFSMLEIYNEQVRDLLQKVTPKGGLQVRQNPKLGLFYVQDLRKVAVGSYKEIEKRIAEGSKTVMIAALSPADINYDETLGTLRYADRAKKIKNKAVINENPLDKLIRELREENEKLKKALSSGSALPTEQVTMSGLTAEEREEMRKQMEEEIRAQLMANMEALEESGSSWEEKAARDHAEFDAENKAVVMTEARKNKEPYFMNLNVDPLLSGLVVHFLGGSQTTIGRKDAEPTPTVILSGLRIVFIAGSNHMYIFKNPLKPCKDRKLAETIDWEFAQTEIAQAKGFATGGMAGLSKDQQRAQEQVLEILPLVSEANAISEELNKHKGFEVVLISAAAQEGGKETKVMVKMKNLLNGNTWLWERGKFMNRRYLMQDLYQRWLDGDEDVNKIPKEEDPFWEPTEDVMIGSCNAFLQSLGYALDFDDGLAVTDYKGTDEGTMYINITPCTQTGKPIDEDMFVDDPFELLGKPFHFKVNVKSCDVNKARYSKGLFVKYRVHDQDDYTQTKTLSGSLSPEWNHSKVVSFPSMTKDHLEYFDSGCITFLLYGVQEDTMPDSNLSKMSTKEIREMESIQSKANNMKLRRKDTQFGLDTPSDLTQIKAEYVLLQKKFDRLERKERRLQDICKDWENKPVEQQQYEPFFRAVSAVAYSTGTKLKTRVHLINRILQGHKSVQGGAAGVASVNVMQQTNNTNGKTKSPKANKKQDKAENSKTCLVM